MRSRASGFTLIELIIVTVVLAILAVTALPRFGGKADVEERAAQDQLMAALRLIQNRAMQQTSASFCQQVLVTAKQLGSAATNPCTATSAFSSQQVNAADQFVLVSSGAVSLQLYNAVSAGTVQSLPYRFRFNALGRPVTDASPGVQLSNGLRLVLSGALNLAVCIQAEGYIHPC
ncbi:type II secretion system protein [Rheinheimera sp.]|uniref:type II secretion system protein n=1 Tax=Rheinheimera sp. TaxID=1869214 RepID=UPI00307F4F06